VNTLSGTACQAAYTRYLRLYSGQGDEGAWVLAPRRVRVLSGLLKSWDRFGESDGFELSQTKSSQQLNLSNTYTDSASSLTRPTASLTVTQYCTATRFASSR